MMVIRTGLNRGALVLAVLGGISASRAASPDVVVLLTDQQRADAMSVVGTPGARTPAMDALAREGVRFTHAFCPTPQCSPARAALWTGRYPHRTGVVGNVGVQPPPAGMSGPLDPSLPGIGRVFAAAGYQTAYFGKWHLGGTPGPHGFEVHDVRQTRGEALTGRVLTWLEQRRREQAQRRPMLLIVSWINPHDIYQIHRPAVRELPVAAGLPLPVSRTDDLAGKPFPQRHYLTEDQGKPFVGYTDDQWRRYLSFYDELTAKADAEIGRVVRAVRAANPDALIVFGSDHGDLGGAHGMPFKGPAMYEELVRVPLVIAWPGKVAPGVRHDLVSQIDLLPTLCDLAGVEPPAEVDGRSLAPLLAGREAAPSAWRDAVFAEYYGKQNWRVPIRMARARKWKYVRYLRYGEELYDLEADPHELHNLAGAAEHEPTRSKLAARLEAWMQRPGDPFARLTVTDRTGNELRGGDGPAGVGGPGHK